MIGSADLSVERLERENDLVELDRFTKSFPRSSPFQRGTIARVYARTKDATPLVLAARDGGGSIVASLVGITFVHGGRLGSFADSWSRHLTVRGTPLHHASRWAEPALRNLLSTLEASVSPGTLYLRHYPDRSGPFTDLLRSRGYVREDWVNFTVDISRPESELLALMSKARRKGIAAAQSHGVVVEDVRSRSELDEVYVVLKEAHDKHRLYLQRPELFEAILDEVVPRREAIILIARHRGKALAVRLSLLAGRLAYDWYAGSTETARTVHADELLVWTTMRRAREMGASTFDFGGAGTPNEKYGPREFKRRFGGEETNFGRFTRVFHPTRLRLARAAWKVAGRVR